MAYFKILYKKGTNKEEIVVESANKIEAIKEFKENPKGIFLKIEEIDEPLEIKLEKIKTKIEASMSKKKIPPLAYIASLRQMAVMLDAGIPINTTLETIVKTSDNKRVKEIFQEAYKDVESGMNLSDSLQRFESEIGNLSIVMIRLGETIGLLSESVNRLADFMQEIYDNRVKLKKATRYPLIVIVAMGIAFSLVLVLVVPQFMDLFSEYNAELPLPTKLLIWLEEAIKNYSSYVLASSAVIFIILSKIYKRNEDFHTFVDKNMLKVYIVGSVIYLSMIGRFIYIFDRLTTSGVPIIESLKTAISVVDNKYLKERLQTISSDIEEGKSLTQGFKDTEQFDTIIIQMIEAGENSGALGKMLEKVSSYYKSKFENLVDNVSTMIEPILIAGIAGFVLLLALGIFLPMWSIADAVGG